MKIAILSCNTGGGHNAAAAALAEELAARGHESKTYNTLDFLPKGAADLISRGHDFAYRYTPKLYGAGYRREEKRPSPLLYENSIRGIGPLYEALMDLGADAAICVHVFPAMMMTELRCSYGLRMPAWFVATDFTCSPGVGELQLDGICIPHPALTPEFEAAGLPRERIYATGIPIRRQFCRMPDRAAARRQRPNTGLLAGLWELPHVEGTLDEAAAARQLAAWGVTVLRWERTLHAKHEFTHLRWQMTGYLLTVAGEGQPDWLWADASQRRQRAIPSAFRVFTAALENAAAGEKSDKGD